MNDESKLTGCRTIKPQSLEKNKKEVRNKKEDRGETEERAKRRTRGKTKEIEKEERMDYRNP